MNEARPLPNPPVESPSLAPKDDKIVCPVCGEEAVREKCKVVCRSDKCRGRIIYNCSEF
jgi:hypothetical protein